MYTLINGWTKESLKAAIKKHNIGKQATMSYSSREIERCVYFNPEDNNRCAVGCCLPNRFIKDHMDMVTIEIAIDELLEKHPLLVKYMPMDVVGLLEFQHAHDSNREKDPKAFHDKLFAWIDNCTTEVKI